VDFKTRGKRIDEMIDVLRLLWTGTMVAHKARFFNFDRLELGPRPPGKIPICMAGGSDIAMRRAAAKCDGWITGHVTRDEIWASVLKIRRMLKEAGREDEPFRVICNITADREIVQGLVDRGVTDIINASSAAEIKGGMTDQQKIDWYKWYADNIIAKVS
jgi:alkanesulfonate monooxygenase SsuD/methylene tetrahydromethanopterin reductase-like flavin-dependent oxidoreductase (luciferase family)